MVKIKNWQELQHFKDRSPPWIKLYREILYQRDIMMISDRNFKVLICLWLLASEDKERSGNLPPISDIAFKLRLSENDIRQSFQGLSDFLIFDDIDMISERYQDDAPETEREGETEREREDIGARKNAKGSVKKPDDVDEETWTDFKRHRKNKKAIITNGVIQAIRKESEKAGVTLNQALSITINRGWTGFEASWLANKKESRNDIIDRQTRECLAEGSFDLGIYQPVLEDLS